MQKFKARWGDDYYLELHNHVSGEVAEMQQLCNAQLLEWADEFGIKPVAANDVHFLNRDDHEALVELVDMLGMYAEETTDPSRKKAATSASGDIQELNRLRGLISGYMRELAHERAARRQ